MIAQVAWQQGLAVLNRHSDSSDCTVTPSAAAQWQDRWRSILLPVLKQSDSQPFALADIMKMIKEADLGFVGSMGSETQPATCSDIEVEELIEDAIWKSLVAGKGKNITLYVVNDNEWDSNFAAAKATFLATLAGRSSTNLFGTVVSAEIRAKRKHTLLGWEKILALPRGTLERIKNSADSESPFKKIFSEEILVTMW